MGIPSRSGGDAGLVRRSAENIAGQSRDELGLLFSDEKAQRAWLTSYNADLGGESPKKVIEDGGADQVRDLVRSTLPVGMS